MGVIGVRTSEALNVHSGLSISKTFLAHYFQRMHSSAKNHAINGAKLFARGGFAQCRETQLVNPAAQKALEQLKNETAAELGLTNYQNIYKGALTSADNGRVAAKWSAR